MDADTAAAYAAWVAADNAWQAALEQKFGNNAGTVRYTAEGRAGELAPLHEAWVQAGDAYRQLCLRPAVVAA